NLLLAVPLALLAWFVFAGEWEGVRDFINWLLGPERMLFFSVMLMVLAMVFYQSWTSPWFAGLLLVAFTLAYFGSAADPNFFKIISKPDNVPITLMIFLVGFTLWLSFRQAAINDMRT